MAAPKITDFVDNTISQIPYKITLWKWVPYALNPLYAQKSCMQVENRVANPAAGEIGGLLWPILARKEGDEMSLINCNGFNINGYLLKTEKPKLKNINRLDNLAICLCESDAFLNNHLKFELHPIHQNIRVKNNQTPSISRQKSPNDTSHNSPTCALRKERLKIPNYGSNYGP